MKGVIFHFDCFLWSVQVLIPSVRNCIASIRKDTELIGCVQTLVACFGQIKKEIIEEAAPR